MALQRERLMTIRELLDSQREAVPTHRVHRVHCERADDDGDHHLLQAALRARIRVLEARVCELEAALAMAP